MANNRISILVALDGSDEGLKRAIGSAERSLGDLSSTAKTAGDKAAAGLAQVKAGLSTLSEQFGRSKAQLLAFLAAFEFAGRLSEMIQIADAWNQMNARLKLATAGSREFAAAQSTLFDIAQRIGVPLQETATLYGKLQQSVRMLGLEQKEAFSLTESISQALRLSGASANEAQASLLQFGQALASGVLRGEEFNSVVENSPRLAQALADGLNVPIGRLRKLAEEGRLTADVVVQALLSQKDRLATEYATLPVTVSQAMTRLSNAFGQWVHKLDESTGFTTKLATALTWLSQNLETVMKWLSIVKDVGLAVLIYRFIPALITAWQTAGAAAVAAAAATSAAWATINLPLAGAVASIGALKTSFAVLGAFLVGWEIGTWLSEHFEIVRKAGILMVQVLMTGLEQLRYHWEVFAAIFTSDTIAEATKRHQARLSEMNQIFREMYADAAKGSEAAKGAMNTAASAAEEVARRLEAVRQGTQEAVGRGVEAVHAALEKLKSRLGEVEQALGKAHQTVNDSTAKMAEAYKGLTAQVEASLQVQIDAVKARYQQEQTALDLSAQSQQAQWAKSVQLLTETLTQQAALRRQATTEALRLIDEESKARIEAARREGQNDSERQANVQRVENEILATKRQTLTQALAEYRSHIDALNAEANRHLAEIRRIEDEKRQLAMSTEDRIRDIRRQGMSEFEATEDRKRQVAELQKAAREALAQGEFDHARALAKQAMELASQVATSQTTEAQRALAARKQAEQDASRVTQFEAQAREAAGRGESAQAESLLRQAAQLRTELAQKTREADAQATQGKEGVVRAIRDIRDAEETLNKTLDAQAQAHQKAALAATGARDEIKQALTQTQAQIEQITDKLKDGLKLSINADTSRFDKALADLDRAIAERERLLPIKADLKQAQKKLQDYEQLLKEGKTLPVDADVSKAKAALLSLNAYAKEASQLELKVATEKAQAAITNVEGQIKALDRIQTESRHLVSSNTQAVRAEIDKLNNANTSSTHTVTVRNVEANATGGVVGQGVRAFAQGGAVSPAFPRMNGGSVPGTGHLDTVPRTLEAGAFVIRKAAVQKYGSSVLAKMANGISRGVARFGRGGAVSSSNSAPPAASTGAGADARNPDTPKRNRDVTEVQKMIELGQQGMREYVHWLQSHYGGSLSVNMGWRTSQYYEQQAQQDRPLIEGLLTRKQLTGAERQTLDQVKATWRHAMAQPLVWGKDLERDLLDYMAQHQGEFYRRGGLSSSDTVPAMLTPGEYVVNKAAVARHGAGFFEAINNMAVPARALAQRVQGFAAGGLVQPLAGMAPSMVRAPLPSLADAVPARTIRVELASGGRQITATVDARDESRLLDLLRQARARST